MKVIRQLAPFLAVFLAAQANAQTSTDPFEPDNLQPLAGARINGARPQFIFPPDFDPATELPEIERWTITGRDFANALDIDWVVFYIDQYIYTPLAGQIRVRPTSVFSEENLRVEIATFNRESLLDFSIMPTILQSCFDSPVGNTVINLGSLDFLALYRLRACPPSQKAPKQAPSEPQPYEVEFEINDREEMGNVVGKISGTVRDIRDGQVVTGAAVFTQVNDITFGDPETGLWSFAIVNAPSIILDFLAAGIDSIGPLDLGPVGAGDVISGVTLQASPPGLVFYAGFESP